MPRQAYIPRVFIGSSSEDKEVARLVRKRLERDDFARCTIWDEGVFTVNRGYLEELLDELTKHDFAILIWGANDVTEIRGETLASPRDNVIFECGLFMGALGRDRVFIIREHGANLRIPSDLAGLTLGEFDRARIAEDGEGAVGSACDEISGEIKKPRFPNIVGEWKSRYPISFRPGHDESVEDIEIHPSRGGISIVSKNNPENDYYTSHGRIHFGKQIVGYWNSRLDIGDAEGLFMLTIRANSTVICGYFTGPDENNAPIFGTWVMAKKSGATDKEVEERLRWGEEQLRKTLALPLPGGGT